MNLGASPGLSVQTMLYATETTIPRLAARPRRAVLDAVVVGGGPAGLSAALVLGRARQNVLDTGKPANSASANAIGGLLSQGGVTPADLRRTGREQLAEFPTVDVRDGELIDADLAGAGLWVRLGDGA